jgi:hypothetical protein
MSISVKANSPDHATGPNLKWFFSFGELGRWRGGSPV